MLTDVGKGARDRQFQRMPVFGVSISMRNAYTLCPSNSSSEFPVDTHLCMQNDGHNEAVYCSIVLGCKSWELPNCSSLRQCPNCWATKFHKLCQMCWCLSYVPSTHIQRSCAALVDRSHSREQVPCLFGHKFMLGPSMGQARSAKCWGGIT